MKLTQYIITLSVVLIWCIISIFDHGYWYFEYKYYCNIQTNNRITITTNTTSDQYVLCLSYLKSLDQTVNEYTQKIKIAQDNITAQPTYSEYRNSYIEEMQPKLLQSRILHTQIIRAMDKFEQDLFRKTMIYVRYRYKTIRQNLIKNIERRGKALESAIKEWDQEAVLRINKKYRSDKLKLETINLMLEAQNFSELMPFYTMLQKWKFDY
jgi:hypothetical protein